MRDFDAGLTLERLRGFLDYNPQTGKFHRKTERKSSGHQWSIGDEAGTVDISTGYVRIKIDGRFYLCHRLAWFYVYGIWPSDQIDHENLNRADNRLDNLREANNGLNNANRHLRPNNKTGFKGVYQNDGNPKFLGQIRVKGRAIYLGSFDTAEAAHAAYLSAAEYAFGEFARSGNAQA